DPPAGRRSAAPAQPARSGWRAAGQRPAGPPPGPAGPRCRGWRAEAPPPRPRRTAGAAARRAPAAPAGRGSTPPRGGCGPRPVAVAALGQREGPQLRGERQAQGLRPRTPADVARHRLDRGERLLPLRRHPALEVLEDLARSLQVGQPRALPAPFAGDVAPADPPQPAVASPVQEAHGRGPGLTSWAAPCAFSSSSWAAA